MNKVLKGLVAVAATAAMAVAGFAGASTAMAAENNYDITVPTTDTHTYSVYQVFTGDLSEGTLSNIKPARTSTRTIRRTSPLPMLLLRLLRVLMLTTRQSWQPSPRTLIWLVLPMARFPPRRLCPLLLATTCLRIRML